MNRRQGSGVSLGSAAVLFLCGGALGVGATAVVLNSQTPQSLRPPVVVGGTMPVTMASFTDPRPVDLMPTLAATPSVRTPVDGVLVSSSCRPGKAISSGGVVAKVGATRIVALATKLPLWRDLKRGIKGKDVVAVNTELKRLGRLKGSANSVVSNETVAALASLAGMPAKTRVVPFGRFAFLPSQKATFGTCPASQGTNLAAGAEVATLTPEIESLRLTVSPDDAVPGERNLVVGKAVVPMSSAVLVDRTALDAIAATAEFATWRTSKGDVPLSASWELATPISAAAVPASVIFGRAGATCVSAQGTSVRVSVLSSSLGRSMIRFDGQAPSAVDLAPNAEQPCP